ncbi:hypothetical protein [Lactococcus allomyrinae]|uniref:hypothetical protein n=1 Tax=Lactococcus allomyrinae TaxID=2419773 RepID=UPI0013C4A83D|nr:hypothetical protein [Lactococcus allomyrinae]
MNPNDYEKLTHNQQVLHNKIKNVIQRSFNQLEDDIKPHHYRKVELEFETLIARVDEIIFDYAQHTKH